MASDRLLSKLTTAIILLCYLSHAQDLTDSNIHCTVRRYLKNPSKISAVYGPISDWNVSGVTNMHSLFYNGIEWWERVNLNITGADCPLDPIQSLNLNLSGWDTSNVVDISYMFKAIFNGFNVGDIGGWDVRKVKDASYAFSFIIRGFNAGDIGRWNVQNVRQMECMFQYSRQFDAYLGDWDVQNVVDASNMFESASNFSGKGLEQWNVSSIRTFENMFANTGRFNQNLCWDIFQDANVANMFDCSCGNNYCSKSVAPGNISAFAGCEDATLDCHSGDDSHSSGSQRVSRVQVGWKVISLIVGVLFSIT